MQNRGASPSCVVILDYTNIFMCRLVGDNGNPQSRHFQHLQVHFLGYLSIRARHEGIFYFSAPEMGYCDDMTTYCRGDIVQSVLKLSPSIGTYFMNTEI